MLAILRALTQLLKIWWTKDRIRVARSEGKLFRICVGDRLLLVEKLFVVTTRLESNSSFAQVEYVLEEEQSELQDRWTLGFAMGDADATLNHNHDSRQIPCDQICVLGRT